MQDDNEVVVTSPRFSSLIVDHHWPSLDILSRLVLRNGRQGFVFAKKKTKHENYIYLF